MYHHYKGYFIVVEGVDGVGKTTAIKSVIEILKSKGIDAVATSESAPVVEGLDNTFASTLVNLIKLESTRELADPLAQSLMINAARRSHFQNVLVPLLEAGKVVVMDRFYLSTFYNYQKDCKKNGEIYALALSNLKPDYTVVLSTTSRIASERLAARSETVTDYTDSVAMNNFAEIQEKLVSYVSINPGAVVDASTSADDVADELAETLLYAIDVIDENRTNGTCTKSKH